MSHIRPELRPKSPKGHQGPKQARTRRKVPVKWGSKVPLRRHPCRRRSATPRTAVSLKQYHYPRCVRCPQFGPHHAPPILHHIHSKTASTTSPMTSSTPTQRKADAKL